MDYPHRKMWWAIILQLFQIFKTKLYDFFWYNWYLFHHVYLTQEPEWGYVENILPSPGFEKSNAGKPITFFTFDHLQEGQWTLYAIDATICTISSWQQEI